jgi:intergrase/recombinase
LRQPKADNYIPSNEYVINAYNKISDKKFKTIFKLLDFSGGRSTELEEVIKEYHSLKLIINHNFTKY